MDIYIYSDESGVFDRAHQDYFVYGGLIFLSEKERDEQIRKYRAAEKMVRGKLVESEGHAPTELKASKLPHKWRIRLFRAANLGYRFGVVEHLKMLTQPHVFASSENKARHQDYVYKRGVKTAIADLIGLGKIDPKEPHRIHIIADEHTIATSGYSLDQSIYREFCDGVYHPNYGTSHGPILPQLESVTVKFVDSTTSVLVRAADIIANRLLHYAQDGEKLSKGGITVLELPDGRCHKSTS